MSSFLFAVLALLATPGPTNTLMAASGAQRGLAASLPLIVAELGAYLIAITIWLELVGSLAASQPWVAMVARLVAVSFLVWSAWKLWRDAGRADLAQRGITARRVLLTTLLNPKALIFAFAIFPQVDFGARLPYLAAFSGLVALTAVAWMSLGALAAKGSGALLTSRRIERIAATALAVFAALLLVQTLETLL